jgi:LPXTG-site transpeptidase (sortase) family protein
MNSANIKQICDLIKKSSNPLILIPENFDIDTICGALGLYLFLKKNNKNPSIACSSDISEKFAFLGGQNIFLNNIEEDCLYKISFNLNDNRIKELSYVQEGNILKINLSTLGGELRLEKPRVDILKFNHDLIFVLGSPGLSFLGKIYSENACFFSLMDVVNIDCHKENEKFGKINLIKPNSSVSEISADIANTFMREMMDNRIADLFLTGIVAKTDNFQSEKIRASTFEMVSVLLRTGANREEVVKRLIVSNFLVEEKIEYYPSLKITKEIIDKINKEYFWRLQQRRERTKAFDGLKSLTLNQKVFYIAALLGTIQGIIVLERSGSSTPLDFTHNETVLEENSTESEEKPSLSSTSIFLEKNETILPILRDTEQASMQNEIAGVPANTQERMVVTSVEIVTVSPTPIPSLSSSPNPSPKIAVKENIGLPKKFSLPLLGINTVVQEVGLTEKGEMGSPNNFTSVGWYKFGVKPGENGNAVIAGHLDTYTSSAGIFWNLNKLKSGDYLYVTDEYNKKMRFRVVKSEVYDAENAPLDKIFGLSGKPHLNLITCNGAWDLGKKSYNKRLVIFIDYDPE